VPWIRSLERKRMRERHGIEGELGREVKL